MDILNSHEYFNKLQVYKGIRQAHSNSVSAYILECKLKKAVKLYASSDVLQQLLELYNTKFKKAKLIIRREDLFLKIEKLKVESLEKLIVLFEQEGILQCLIQLLNRKK